MKCALCIVQRAVCSVQCSVCSVQCEVSSVQCAVCSVQFTVCSVQYAVSSMQYAVCSVQCVLPKAPGHFLPTVFPDRAQSKLLVSETSKLFYANCFHVDVSRSSLNALCLLYDQPTKRRNCHIQKMLLKTVFMSHEICILLSVVICV